MKFRAVLALAGAALLSACGINSVPTAEETAKARWADVQTNYQRRADLVPNLVNTVKGAAASEGKILNDVTSARARATQIQLSGDDLTDPSKVSAFNQAQNGLSLSLQRLQEAYPQLQSQGNFKTLMDQLEGTENRIAISIRDYNTAVQDYNTRIRTFPDAVGAKIFYGSKPMTPFQAQAGADKAPTVDFGNTN
ncbi:LemA family protein [Sphingomonas sp. HF-S4]|uniref:LemA family protein n=1 Tax=Sphingomonas agrestis TaxID=3080540 RepID=A0ABU3YBY5_9SPHN|nr:LemA family protein [Sphingomonas sp. HF-S4]MDV3458662.1 LemA family protein [Sphingomonas sp. HF-S4]